ncbi:MAG: hypothetical protein AAF220_07665, partial [Pseudomonadota bacterium]
MILIFSVCSLIYRRHAAPIRRTRFAISVLVLSCGLSACATDPLKFIPETERALMLAEERRHPQNPNAGPISVEELLKRAAAGDQSHADRYR